MLNMVKIIFRMRGFAWYARTVPVLLPLAQVKNILLIKSLVHIWLLHNKHICIYVFKV